LGSPERRKREREALQSAIIGAAREILSAEGPEALTMRRVAEKIEYSATTIYLHFTDKEALIAALCDSDFGQLAERFAGIARIADPIERLRRAAHLYLQFGAEYPRQYEAMFLRCAGRGAREAYAFLQGILREGVEQGCFRREFRDAELLAQSVWAGIHGVVALEISGRSEPWVEWRPFERRAASMVDALITALTAK